MALRMKWTNSRRRPRTGARAGAPQPEASVSEVSTPADRHAAARAEAQRVLDRAWRHFPRTHGRVQATAHDDRPAPGPDAR